jgi:uncharacterized protein YecT (DUF1311 family)
LHPSTGCALLKEKQMKRLVILLALALSSAEATAQTQREMNEASRLPAISAQAELDRVYKAVREAYKDDALFLEKLRAQQQIWEIFRKATADLEFPISEGEERFIKYGSVFPMCWNPLWTMLTGNRAAELQRWLVGTIDGDVCAGSMKRDHELEAESTPSDASSQNAEESAI